MSKTPYENLHDIWNEAIEIINESETQPEDFEDIINFPNLDNILQSFRSVYTGVTADGEKYKYSPIFPSDLCKNSWIVLSGSNATDVERAGNYLLTSGNETISTEELSEYNLHYAFMGYTDKITNPTAAPYLGGVRKEIFNGVEMLAAYSWFIGHWNTRKPTFVQLIPGELYSFVKRIFEIIDEYTSNAYAFNSYLDARNQYYCASKYDALSEENRLSYLFNAIFNYEYDSEEEDIDESGENSENEPQGDYGPHNNYNPKFNMYALRKLPIGYVYISTASTNPSDIFGYGTWESFAEGRMLIGVDPNDSDFDEALKEGGEKTHTLTVNEMPSHNHNYTRYVTNNGYPTGANITGGSVYYWKGNTSNNATTTSVGGGMPHNNMPPYITVFMFRRVS